MAKSPGEILRIYMEEYIEENNLPCILKDDIPKKWEKYGDFVLFDIRSFSKDLWLKQGTEFWLKICDILKCKRLALKNKIRNDEYRTPNVKILVGIDPWVSYVDNGIKYTWNVEKNMFCAGNASERHRIANLNCRNEVIVDLFAGIGYFVLPYLIHAKAHVVHACEWNPDAVVALRRNLEINNVEDKCIVYEGDNSRVCPKGVADRVNLGLIPSSEGSWRVACEALKPIGGILHVHGNVETRDVKVLCEKCKQFANIEVGNWKVSLGTDCESIALENSNISWKRKQWLIWGVHVLHSLISILREMDTKKIWICSIENIHNVKSYAPHVDHIVLDASLNLT